MKNPNKIFITILSLCCLIIIGIIIENAYLTNKKPHDIILATPEILLQEDKTLTEIKNKLKNAGIIPREAKHWKEIN